MSNAAKGNDYENFVETVYKAVLEAERRQGKIAAVVIERNKTIISKSGASAEIDIYWEHQVAGITHKVAIECKNYNKNIDIPSVRDFARKIEHISGLKGLMVTKRGYSENAITEASSDNIDLLVIREKESKDFEGYLTQINVQMHVLMPPRATNIIPVYDREWMFANGYKAGDSISYNVASNLMVFEDTATEFKFSLHELQQKNFFQEKGTGEHVWEKHFEDGWLYLDTVKLKIKSVQITYNQPQPVQQELNINLEQYILAIMEYINGQKDKFVVLKTGERKAY